MVVTLITYYITKYTQYIYIYIYIKKRVLQPQEPSIKFCSLEFLRVLVPAPRLIFKDKSFSTRLTNLFIVVVLLYVQAEEIGGGCGNILLEIKPLYVT